MTSRPESFTPQPYDPYADDDAAGGWFNSDGYIPRQQGHEAPQGYDYDPRTYPYQQQDDQPTYALRTVEQPAPAPAEPAYRIPESPEVGWDMAASRRRTWVSRAVLLFVLAIQAVLSLRLSNTAFQDEALYLSAGHAEVAHLLHGTPLPMDYAAYFSGSPQLYPVLAAVVDERFGLAGARALSLLFMLGTTALLYALTRRMFNERAALAGAALFAVLQSTVVLGNYATYDAAALFLLALTAWIVVRTAAARAPVVLAAVPVAVLAVGVKYGAALYLPTLVGLALLTAWPHRGKGAFGRALLFAAAMAGLLYAGAHTTGLLAGVQQTTTDRAHGTDSAGSLLHKSVEWGGLTFLTACGGAASYVRRSRMNESPLSWKLSGPGWRWRSLLGLLLCGTAVLAPAYQMYLHTQISLFKHIGFGLLFAAPMAGVGVTRLIGPHFRYPQLGIMLWAVTLCVGISQADYRFGLWPNSTEMVATIKPYVHGKSRHYLSSTPEVSLYYLGDRSTHRQWSSGFGITYKDKKGRTLTGNKAYRAALRDGWYDLVVLDGLTNKSGDKAIAAALQGNPRYRLLAELPFKNSSGTGRYRIWIKTAP